jgi:hypothetical protein
LWYVATTPCCDTASSSLRTWSGRARALPSSDMRASLTFIISVPVEMSENNERIRTPPGLQAGAGTSSTLSSPDR